MLIGVLADTHDHLPMLDRAMEIFIRRDVRAVLHAGDIVAPFAARRLLRYRGPIYPVYGNNDGERAGLQQVLPAIADGPRRLELAGRRIVLHHFIDWCSTADLEWANIIITGHTHQVVNRNENGTLFLNPGECCGWVYNRCTIALLDTELLRAEILDL
ncbi:MAG: hypothetical protein HJJLKODD_01576 [Phycisphaerae bacterium]|nr:hypothetical protein [Phycisphaerae bacterium]